MDEKILIKNIEGQFQSGQSSQLVSIIKAGGVGILPTDTLYGIVASALNEQAVEKVYEIRKRELNKPLIVLISKIEDLQSFEISLTDKQLEILTLIWPEKVSIILPCESEKFSYLHRGTKSIAFRMPADIQLRAFIERSRPLVAPSANMSGFEPAKTIEEAKNIFGSSVDFYVDRGLLDGASSTLAKINKEGIIEIVREGAFELRTI